MAALCAVKLAERWCEMASKLLRSTRQQVEGIVTEHTEDCLALLYETNACTCDAMTDEQIDAELLEKEAAKE